MERDALLPFYEAQLPRMRRLAGRYLGYASPDIDDVLQDVFLQAWLHCGTLREDSRCAGWLLRMTANACVTFLRHARFSTPCALPPEGEAEDVYARMMDRLTIEEIMVRLTPSARRVVEMHHIEGYSLREVAGRLRRPESTVKSTFYRAKALLHSA